MPQIYEITARFRRQTQPVQYQAAESELVVKAQLSEAEYQAGDAAKLLHETKTTVLTSLGLAVEATAPAGAASSTAAGAAAGGGEAQPKKVERKKAEKPAATDAKEPAPTSAADMSSMDGAGQTPAASKPEGVSDEDLQKTASAASQRCGSAAKVKALMKEHGVARLGELPQEKRKAFIEACDGLKKDE